MIILDDVISLEKQIILEKLTLDNTSFPWGFNRSANFGPSEEHNDKKKNPLYDADNFLDWPNIIDTFSFNHALFHDGKYSNYFPMFMDLLKPLNVYKLLRFKLNITTYNPDYNSDSYGYPHCDMSALNLKKYNTAIYYINDSDGDTLIFNERFGEKFDKFTLQKRVIPKRGRMVVFDGNYYHAGITPKNNNPRVVANINYIPRNT